MDGDIGQIRLYLKWRHECALHMSCMRRDDVNCGEDEDEDSQSGLKRVTCNVGVIMVMM